MGTCYLCQPPKKILAGVTHRIFAINEDRSNRLDLVFGAGGKLIDHYFCSVADGRRVPLDPETEKAVELIVSAIKNNKNALTLVEDCKANPSWIGGEISPDASTREFELNTLDWPKILAEKITSKIIRLINFSTGVRVETVVVSIDEIGCLVSRIALHDGNEFSSAEKVFFKALNFATQKVIESGQNFWLLLKEQVAKINKAAEGQLPFIILEEEHVIIFQTENWLEILATNIPLDWK